MGSIFSTVDSFSCVVEEVFICYYLFYSLEIYFCLALYLMQFECNYIDRMRKIKLMASKRRINFLNLHHLWSFQFKVNDTESIPSVCMKKKPKILKLLVNEV